MGFDKGKLNVSMNVSPCFAGMYLVVPPGIAVSNLPT
jgi:hypothetical protein